MKFKNLIIKKLWFLKQNFKLSRPKLKIPIEIQIADHCNLNCIGCSHYSPISDENFINLENLNFSIERLSSFKNFISTIRILGGEPLLNKELPKIVHLIRNYFPTTEIIIVTNGILLLNDKNLSENFWYSLKKNNVLLSVTIYPLNINYDKILDICKKENIPIHIYGSRIKNDSFNLFLLDKKKKGNIFNFYRCFESECFQLVDDKIFTCPQSAYSNKLNNKFGSNFNIINKDYLDLHNISLWSFIKFINTPKPFCKYCIFPRNKIKWSKSNFSSSEWIQI